MNHLIASAIANTLSFFKGLQVKRLVAFFFVSGLLFLANVKPVLADTYSNKNTAPERTLDRLEQANKNTERPKTTGEFLDEARGDVPLGERINNITRDSAEAFKQFGKLYTTGAQENARSLKDKTEQATENLVK